MNVQEFDTALSDLETRVDRLRALYENWFRGYEKMEPSVARKDVERRVYGLRKELPRNTALRFRYHQVYQRYTTLATYWQRTARQIEEGTYRLQLQRMKRRRPADDDARTLAPRAHTGEEGDSGAPPSYELSLDETLDVRQLLDDLDLDQVARAIDVRGPHGASGTPVPAAPSPVRATGRFGRPSFGPDAPDAAPLLSGRPPAAEGDAESTSSRSLAPARNSAAPGPTPGAQGPRPTVLDAPGDPARASTPGDPLRPDVANSNGTPGKSSQTFAKPAALKVSPIAPPGMLKPGAPAAFPSPSTGTSTGTGARIIPAVPPRTTPGTGQHAAPPRAPAPPVPGTSTAPGRTPAPPLPGPPGSAARPSLATGRPAAGPRPTPAEAQPAPRPQQPAAPTPAPASRPAQPSLSPPVARPQQPSLSPAARPAQPSLSPPTAARAGADMLGEQRMRRLYDEYAAARKKNNEGDVRYETLASSIQKMLPDLSKKHQGKQIDFEVVVKDGRVGLKPKAT